MALFNKKELALGNDIKKLSILGSGTCNLSCEYCFLKGLNKQHFDKEIVEKLIDGSYLKTIQQVLLKCGANNFQIEELTFWGGECTIHADLWSEYILDWLHAFPNISAICFVSNGLFNPNAMNKLLAKINQFGYESNRFININIQISLDGPEGINSGRPGLGDQLKNNFLELDSLMLKNNYKNLMLHIPFKSTLPVDTFNQIHSSLDSAEEYWEWWHKFLSDCLLNKKSEFIDSHIFTDPIITMLYDYTQQQGIDLTKSLITLDLLNWEGLQKKYKLPFTLSNESSVINGLGAECYPRTNHIKDPGFCGAYMAETMIRPDGVIVGCLVGLYNDKEEYLTYNKEHDYDEYLNCLRVPSKYHFDPLNMDDHEIFKFQKQMADYQQAFNTLISGNLAILIELANCGQVNPEYLVDSDLAFRHSSIITGKTMCFYNSLRKTGSPFVSTLGQVRLLCNGVLQYIDYRNRLGVSKHEVRMFKDKFRN